MADVINFNDQLDEPNEANIKEILEEVLKLADSVEDICIFIKDKNKDYALFYSHSLELPDKSFLIQMLQHDIHQELTVSEEFELEQDQ